MRLLPIILVILLIIFIIPIPIKIKFQYINKNINFFLYNKKMNFHKIKEKRKEADKTKRNKKSIDYMCLFSTLNDNNFKPSLKFKMDFEYGTSDAANTALLYGGAWTCLAFIYRILFCLFNIKNFDTKIEPDFNKKKLNISIESILFISLVKVIYIAFIIIKNQKRSGNYG